MPFAYYGAKHKLSGKYPPPAHPVIIEPFAGSAGYSVRHCAWVDYIVLIDSDPAVIDLWAELQTMTDRDLDLLDHQLERPYASLLHPLIAGMAGSSTWRAAVAGHKRVITPWMREQWPTVKARIKRTLPHLHKFQLSLGDWWQAPEMDATWFIDPPYQSIVSTAGSEYRHSEIDYPKLGDWCRTRPGQVIVCEQSPASWLPFQPLARQVNGAATGSSTRTEMIWRNDAEQLSLW